MELSEDCGVGAAPNTHNLICGGLEYTRDGVDEILSLDEPQCDEHTVAVHAPAAPQRVHVLRLLHQHATLGLR